MSQENASVVTMTKTVSFVCVHIIFTVNFHGIHNNISRVRFIRNLSGLNTPPEMSVAADMACFVFHAMAACRIFAKCFFLSSCEYACKRMGIVDTL